jgi:hypothetical protein
MNIDNSQITLRPRLLLISGRQWEQELVGNLQSRHVYLLDVASWTWTELPPLKERRIGHACGVYRLANGTRVVIAAGGITGDMHTSNVTRIEVFNIEVGAVFVSFNNLHGALSEK